MTYPQQASTADLTFGAPSAPNTDLTFGGGAPPAATNGFKCWSGSAWVQGTARRWDGATWVPVTAKRWDGTAWVVF